MARPAGDIPDHGTRQRYQLRGTPCRCDACREANADYVLLRRAGRATRTFAWGQHKGYYPRGTSQPKTMRIGEQLELPPEFVPRQIFR